MTPLTALIEAARLLGESRRHFRSRHVAEARRLIEQAITQLGEYDDTDRETKNPHCHHH